MKTRYISFLLLVITVSPGLLHAQGRDTGGRLWAFPITAYTMQLSDSVTVVQVHLPGVPGLLKEKALGALYGVYKTGGEDAESKGYGRCHLVKGDYYYFSIKTTAAPEAGDLLYTAIPAGNINRSPVAVAASHAIRFIDVDGKPFYTPDSFLKQRTAAEVEAIMQGMITDIKRVGTYYLQADTTLNKPVTAGAYKGKGLMQVLSTCTKADLSLFLQYVAARPRLYAGREWKVSETFATWLTAGAPTVKN